jgi:hypothetical protein
MKITISACGALASRAPGRDGPRKTYWDEDLPGFGVRQGADGRLSYVLKSG